MLDNRTQEEQRSKEYFQYGNKTVEYLLIKSKRRKTSEITVDKEGITVRVPFNKTLQDVQNILNKKSRWITIKQKDFQNEKSDIAKPSYPDRSTLSYLGKNYELNIFPCSEDSAEKFVFDESRFIVSIHHDNKGENQNDKIRSLYVNWLASEASEIFRKKVDNFCKIVNVKPKGIEVKNLVNRWGSVTKEGSINLNAHLVKAPYDIIDYIIIHELCHFVIKGHSHHFWDYLKQFVPDYQQKVKWLEKNLSNLLS
ncbi:MAG: M48 family metallopeptidase [Candidatus Nitrosocosmicus sp.]|nr:M48 family metallopeptidase [Candidatus Nitrosocosmicus sp.]MDN5869003.1 M48 family metallopeptidase [Candidatus Nitrosocosmicus sp.]